MNGRRRIWIAVAIAAAALGGAEAPAGAKAKVDSFEGSCSFEGTSRFSPPATNEQQSLDVTYAGPGSCSGTLNGRSISNAPITVGAAFRDVDGSCLRADTTQPGRGAIRFADGTTIRFTAEFHFVSVQGTYEVRGERSGSGRGTGTFVTDRTPPDVALQCAGEGVRQAPLDISLTTDSPLVTKRRGNGRRPTGHSGPNTFSGSCAVSGAVAFDPPLTNEPRPIDQRARAQGTCSGTFVDRRGRTHELSDAPVTFSETSHGDAVSCTGGTATGRGSLRFRHGKIGFSFSEARVSGGALISLEGDGAGSAEGLARVSDSEDPADILERCAGSGLKRVAIGGELVTTPSISG